MAEWRDAQLSELIDIKHGFAFRGEFFADEATSDILVTPGNFAIGGGFQLNKPKFYNGPVPQEYVLKPGDVIVTMTDLSKQADTLGYSAVVPMTKARLLHNQRIGKVIAKQSSVNVRFISWLMRTRSYRQEIVGGATGSTVKHTSPGRILAHRVKLPSPLEQQGIVEVLQPLEDKIELNRQTNQTLEALAQSIFRDWFVEFGPTRRKAAGETDPVAIMGGMSPSLATLFPDAFGDDGLPGGWCERPLDSIADFLNGLALQKFPVKAGEPDLPVIKIAELRNGLAERTNRAARTLPAKYIIKDGDFLFSWSGSLMAKVWTLGEGALNQHLFKVSSDEFPQWFYGQWVHHHLPEFQLIAASKATTMGHIQRGQARLPAQHRHAASVRPTEGGVSGRGTLVARPGGRGAA